MSQNPDNDTNGTYDDTEHYKAEAEKSQREQQELINDYEALESPTASKPIYLYIAQAKAHNVSNKKIAEDLGMTQSWVSTLVNKPEIKDLTSKYMASYHRERFRSQMEEAAVKGLNGNNKN